MAQSHSPLRKINQRKYGVAPSWEQVDAFVKETGMRRDHFERFYGIPYNTLIQIRTGRKKTPANIWHIFYEKIKPAYGAGFIGDIMTDMINGKPVKKNIKKMVFPKKEPDAVKELPKKNVPKKEFTHSRLAKLQ